MAILKQGSTILNAGAKGDKGDSGGGSLANSFTPTSIADLQSGTNTGKIASIETEIDLGTATLTLQKGMILQFNGGSFTNGEIVWNNNPIEANPFVKLFDETNTSHSGLVFPQDINIEWFGAVADNTNYINSKAGNITTSTYGVCPTDRANEFMNVAQGSTLVFSDTSDNYLVNLQDVDDGDNSTVKINMGIRYSANNTNIRIDKGVTVKGDTNNHDYYSIFGLWNVDNINIFGGGIIEGDLNTHIRYRITLDTLVLGAKVKINGNLYTGVAGVKSNNTEFSLDSTDGASAIDLADSYNNDTRDRQNGDFLAVVNSNTVEMYPANGNLQRLSVKDEFGGITLEGLIGNGIAILPIRNCNFITIDNITMRLTTGDGVAMSPGFNYVGGELDGYILGDLDSSGNEVASTTAIRTNLEAITNALYDELGYIMVQAGSYSSYDGKGLYSAYFYDALGDYVGRKTKVWMYEKVEIPEGATQVRCVFFQSKFTYTDNGGTEQPLRYQLRPSTVTSHLTIKECDIYNVARNGISVTGAQYLTIKNNYIHDISGEPILNSAIDIEDGYRINRYINIVGNRFKNCGLYDIPIQRAHGIVIDGNHFLKGLSGIRLTTDSYDIKVVNNNFYGGTIDFSGDCIASNNNFNENFVKVQSGIITDSYLKNSNMVLQPFEDIVLDGLVFKNDEIKLNQNTGDLISYSLSDGVGGGTNPRIDVRNITIDGQDVLSAIQLRHGNTFVKNITVTNSTSKAEMDAKSIDGFYGTDFYCDPYLSGTTINNINVRRLYIQGACDNLIINNSTFGLVDSSIDFDGFINLGPYNYDKIKIINSVFKPDNNSFSSEGIEGTGNIGGLIFNNNEYYLPDNIRPMFNLTGTLTGTYVYKNNIITGTTFNTEVGGITTSNVIDGVETN